MNEVVDFVRSRGYLVLVANGDGYRLDDRDVTARQLLTLANHLRMRADLSLFPLDLANPTHKRRNRQKGSLQLLVTGVR